ncbi:MAG: hypothetical protein AAFV53_22580 [Myxococcota bacterium]
MERVAQIHHRWRRQNLRWRLAEASTRLLSISMMMMVGWLWSMSTPVLIGLLCGILAGEVAVWVRRPKSVDALAAALDRGAKTGWLMQTALAVERDPDLGDPELARAVIDRAIAMAPRLTPLALRPYRLPRWWLGGAALAAATLLIPAGPLRAPEFAPPLLASDPLFDADVALVQAEPSEDRAQRIAAPGAGVGVSGEGGSNTDGGASGSGSGNTQTIGVHGGKSRAQENGTLSEGDEAVSSREEEQETEDAAGLSDEDLMKLMSAESAASGYRPSDNPSDRPMKGLSPNRGTANGEIGSEAETSTADLGAVDEASPGEDNNTGGSRSEQADGTGEASDETAEASDPGNSLNLMNDTPQIESGNDDKIWDPLASGAGMGGINDANATERSVAGTGRDDVRTVEEWVESRWQRSPEGIVRSIDGGMTGGQSALEYEEIYTQYARIADVAVNDEAIPPGRRDYIRRYFERIRPADAEDSDDRRATDPAGL